MKKVFRTMLALVACVAILTPGCDGRATPGKMPDVGDEAPNFTLETTDGESISLSDLRGKIVVLNFFTTWCAHCPENLDLMQLVCDRESRTRAEVVAINVGEDAAVVKSLVETKGLTFPVLLDTQKEVADKYVPKAKPNPISPPSRPLPTTYFIDSEGVIKQRVDQPFAHDGEIQTILDSL